MADVIRAVHSDRRQLTREDWQGIVRTAIERTEHYYAELASVPGSAAPSSRPPERSMTPIPGALLREMRIPLSADTVIGSSPISPTYQSAHDSVLAGLLTVLADRAPAALDALFGPPNARWTRAFAFADPLRAFSTQSGAELAVVSPIGVLHMFRQYFFDFGSFLGPAVEHIWLSPGGTIELFEVKRRRTTTERLFERLTETLSRSEVQTGDRDEVADAMRREDDSNTSMGVQISGGGGVQGIWHAEGSFNYENVATNRTTQEQTHKHMHELTTRLTNEMRTSRKTSFRTTVEAEDESSRHHVIQNRTDKLVNYELRPKVKTVGVQAIHTESRLCWQVYLLAPADDLGVGELVHPSKPEDLADSLQPPEAPQKLQQMETQEKYPFAYEPLGNSDYENDSDYRRGDNDGHIRWQKTFTAKKPAEGYVLFQVRENSQPRAFDDGGDQPTLNASYTVPAVVGSADTFTINLDFVNFNEHKVITFDLKLTWNPPEVDPAMTEFNRKLAEYTEERRRLAHIAYVEAVQEKVKLASNIIARDPVDLRKEEHGCIMRRLTAQLVGDATQPLPVVAELISTMFDLDQMLYFVAPDWWMPRRRYGQEVGVAPTVDTAPSDGDGMPTNGGGMAELHRLPAQQPGAGPRQVQYATTQPDTALSGDLVGWGGIDQAQRDNYLITQDSAPAPLGASLGWLIQLDGDARRNAFLNSSWVTAVIPIKLGKESEAVTWLQQQHVEYIEGLGEQYKGDPIQLPDGQTVHPNTVRDAIGAVAHALQAMSRNIPNPLLRGGELVFEQGFNPIDEDHRLAGQPYTVFDQFAFTVDTDQIVAQEFSVPDHYGH